MAEEAKEAPDIVASTFLVKSTSALVLFDYGVSHSFVLLYFSKSFDHAIENLYRPLKVEIVDDQSINASKVYHSCTLEISNGIFPTLFPFLCEI